MKKWVCTVCGYVYEGEIHLKNVHSAAFLLPSSKSRLLMRSLGHVNMK